MSSDTPRPGFPPALAPGSGGGIDALVEAVRRYRSAEMFMRSQSRDSMHLGKTDMAALRFMLRAQQAGQPVSAAELARRLEISTAATTVLVDRLEKSGHAERRRSSLDGRMIEVWPTASTDSEVRTTMGIMHERMISITAALSAEERATVRTFLDTLASTVSDLDFPASLVDSAPS